MILTFKKIMGDEWYNFQSQVQEYTKKHEKSGWENIVTNEINLNANNPPKNEIFINTIEVELYDLTYEHSSPLKTKPKKNKTLLHDVSPQMDEYISYEFFSTNMKKLNDEQRFFLDDTIYI